MTTQSIPSRIIMTTRTGYPGSDSYRQPREMKYNPNPSRAEARRHLTDVIAYYVGLGYRVLHRTRDYAMLEHGRRAGRYTEHTLRIEAVADTQPEHCPHPPARLYSWYAHDGTLCVGCCDCGTPLRGMA